MALAAYVAAVLADAPIGYWKLDEASGLPQDSSGSGLHMTTIAGAVNYRQAGAMLGGDWSIVMGGGTTIHRNSIGSATDNVTLELWFQPQAVGNATQRVFYNGNGGAGGYGYYLGQPFTGNDLHGLLGGVAWLPAGPTLSNSTWYHLVLTRRAGNWLYFINGAQHGGVQSAAAPGGPGGGTCGIGQEAIQGAWSHLAIYETALSDARIAAHYAAGIAAVPTNARLSQIPVEVLLLPVPFARASQMPVEVLIGTVPAAPATWRPKVTLI
jgi:Concanavalin A-like lectin/glucanases superfamily